MEILNNLLDYQNSLEDALRLETTPEEIKDTKYGKRLIKYLRRRRRKTNRFTKHFSRYFKER